MQLLGGILRGAYLFTTPHQSAFIFTPLAAKGPQKGHLHYNSSAHGAHLLTIPSWIGCEKMASIFLLYCCSKTFCGFEKNSSTFHHLHFAVKLPAGD
jgi:hypothetical protein